MAKRNYYAVLGVDKAASQKEIKAAFRKLARQHHPDVNPGDKTAEGRFKEINEANEVLSDPDKRQKYDRYGENWKQADRIAEAEAAGARTRGPRWRPGSGPKVEYGEDVDVFGSNSPFGDLFGSLGGRRGGRAAAMRGQDVEHPVEVSLEEAYQGATRLLQVSDSSGRPRRLEVKIPPGVKTGSRIRIAGEGGPGLGAGPPGDLWLIITVIPHPSFDRKEDDLYVDVPVSLADIVLGGEAPVPTLKGTNLVLKVPPETQNGRVFRLAGQGMPRLAGGAGDLYARIKVLLPTGLSDREREFFREMKAGRG